MAAAIWIGTNIVQMVLSKPNNKSSLEIESFTNELQLNVTRYESLNDGDIYRFRTSKNIYTNDSRG